MRITNITPQYFTRFRDDNARKVIREVFTAPPEEDYIQPCYNHRFELFDNCQFADVFTSSEDGKIKIEFDKEYLKNKDVEDLWPIEIIEKTKKNQDLGNPDNANSTASSIETMDNIINGVVPEYNTSDYRYYETEEEQQERRLTYLAQ